MKLDEKRLETAMKAFLRPNCYETSGPYFYEIQRGLVKAIEAYLEYNEPSDNSNPSEFPNSSIVAKSATVLNETKPKKLYLYKKERGNDLLYFSSKKAGNFGYLGAITLEGDDE